MIVLRSFPLLGLSLLFYISVLHLGDAAAPQPWFRTDVLAIVLPSGDDWKVSGGDLYLMASLMLLFIEMIRATRPDRRPLVNHSLDVLVFIVALTLFLTQPGYGNSTFFGLVTLSLVDFVAGFIITTAAARRDIAISRPAAPHT